VYNAVAAGQGIKQQFVPGTGNLNNGSVDVLNTDFVNRQTWSDYYLENASFFRMDNAYITYNVGEVLRGKVDLNLSFNCQNVFVITNYTGLDPEVIGGIDGTIYPRPRMYAVGLNATF
jgi:iron complex outermembrane receptor protein